MSAVDMLDEAVLAQYLEANVSGFRGPLSATKFAGGQSNPTFRIDAESGTYVLRRQPPGKLLKSAHAVDREYRVISALRVLSPAPIPSPIPTAMAMMFLSTPPSSQPTTSSLV